MDYVLNVVSAAGGCCREFGNFFTSVYCDYIMCKVLSVFNCTAPYTLWYCCSMCRCYSSDWCTCDVVYLSLIQVTKQWLVICVVCIILSHWQMKLVDAIMGNTTSDDHCTAFINQGGLEPLFSILSLPNLPLDFPNSPACQAVSSVCTVLLVSVYDFFTTCWHL